MRLIASLCLLGLAPGLRAAEIKAPAAAYPAVSAGWAAALPRALGGLAAAPSGMDPLVAGLAGLDAKDLVRLQSLAPVVRALDADLGLTPERFSALARQDRAAALSMALSQAQDDVKSRVELLAAEAHGGGSWRVAAGDYEGRVKLYETTAQLDEIRGRYALYLEPDTRELLDESWQRASARAARVRDALLALTADQGAAPLEEAPVSAGVPASAERPAPASAPSNTVRKLLVDMKATRAGWTLQDLRAVYLAHGFVEREGGKHLVFIHPEFPELRDTLSRSSGPLAKGYPTRVLRVIAQLESLRAAGRPSAPPEAAPAPPRALTLADLDILLTPPASRPRAPQETPPAPPSVAPARDSGPQTPPRLAAGSMTGLPARAEAAAPSGPRAAVSTAAAQLAVRPRAGLLETVLRFLRSLLLRLRR